MSICNRFGKEYKLIAILEYDDESKNKQIDICYLNPGIKDIPKHIEFNDKKIQIILDKNIINHLNDDIILLWDDLDDPLSPMIPVNASLVENQSNSFIIHGEIPENESSLWNLAFKTSDDLKLKSVIIEIYENIPELISSINEETIKYNIENKYDSEILDLEKKEIFYTKLYENYFKTPLLNENIIKICIKKDPESVLKCFKNYPEYKINDENYVKESLKWIKAVDFNPWSVPKEIIQKYLSPMEMFCFL